MAHQHRLLDEAAEELKIGRKGKAARRLPAARWAEGEHKRSMARKFAVFRRLQPALTTTRPRALASATLSTIKEFCSKAVLWERLSTKKQLRQRST